MKLPVVVLVSCMAVGVAGWLGTRYFDSAQGPRLTPSGRESPVPVNWDEVKTLPFPSLLVRPGEVVAATRFKLASRSSGRLVELSVHPGDRVAAASQIAVLAAPELEQALRQAEAELNAARTDLADAESDLIRLTTLAKTQAVSQDALRKGQVRRDRANAAVAAAKAAMASQQENVSELVVRAREPLMVLRRLREPGDLVGPSQPIIEAESANGRRFEAWVPLREIEHLHVGMPVELTLDGQSSPVAAELTRIVESADTTTRSFKIEVSIPGGVGAMAGTFGEVKIRLGETHTVAVTEEALMERAGVTGVFVLVASDEVRFRSVQTGRRFDRSVEVLAGLRPGDRVVLDPPPTLMDGAPVQTAKP
ncbi:MAG: efflux RND transporter periplasmic adaptor subunit [Gammaproteobacteria bacterium]